MPQAMNQVRQGSSGLRMRRARAGSAAGADRGVGLVLPDAAGYEPGPPGLERAADEAGAGDLRGGVEAVEGTGLVQVVGAAHRRDGIAGEVNALPVGELCLR